MSDSLTVYGASTPQPHHLIIQTQHSSLNQKNPFKHLHQNVFHKILNYLLDPDLQNTTTVSRQWKDSTLSAVRLNKKSKLDCLSRFLRNNLKDSVYIKNEQTISEIGIKMLTSETLLDVKFAEEELKHKVVDALNQLSDDEIRSIFELRKSKGQITLPRALPRKNSLTPVQINPTQQKAIAIKEIALDLSRFGLVELAHEVSEIIKLNAEKSEALSSVAKELIDEGRLDEALETAEEIPLNTFKAEVLLYITTSLVKHHHLAEANSIVGQITLAKEKKQAEKLILDAANKS